VPILAIAVFPCAAQGESKWSLELGAGIRYDTNVQITSDGHPDMVYTVESQVGMKYQGADVNLSGTYGLGFELFETYKNLNRVSQTLTLNGDLSRMMGPVFPENSTLRFSEVIDDAPFLPNFQSAVTPNRNVTTGGVSTPRTSVFLNYFEILESSPISPRNDIQLSYQSTYTQYEDPMLVDSLTNGVTIGISHKLTRTDTLNANASYSRFDPHGGGPSFTYTLTVGDKLVFSPVLSGSANLGAGVSRSPILNQPQYNSVGSLSISWSLTEKLQLSAQAFRDFSTNSGITNTVLITDSGTVSLNRQMTKFLSANVALSAARNYSPGSVTSTGVHTDLHSQDMKFGLNYQLATWLVSNLEYHYTRQEGMGTTKDDLNRNQYLFFLRAQWS